MTIASPTKQAYAAHTNTVQALAWSPDGTRVVSGDSGGAVHLWEAASGKTLAIHEDEQHASVCSLAWSPVGGLIASGGRRNSLHLLEAERLNVAYSWSLHRPTALRPGSSFYGRPSHAILSLAWSPDGRRLLGGGHYGPHLHLWETLDGLQRAVDPSDHIIHAVAWSPDGNHFAAAGDFGAIGIWDTTGEQLPMGFADINRQFYFFQSVAWSPDGKRLAATGLNSGCMVWYGSGELLTRYQGHQAHTLSLAWSPVDERIASASQDGTMQVWDATTGQRLATYTCHLGTRPLLAWSLDGKHLAVVLADQTIQIWAAV